MIYIYRRAVSEGGRDLAEALNDAGVPARYTQGGLLREPRVIARLAEGRDRLICWGDPAPVQAAFMLNPHVIASKYADAERLRGAGVATIEVALQRPADRHAVRPNLRLAHDLAVVQANGAWEYTDEGAREIMRRIQEWLASPLPPAQTWLGRRNNHIGGADLLRFEDAQRNGHGINVDYWVKKEDIAHEFRLHMFRGKSIRAGRKIAREVRPDGSQTHPWIRSFDAGWIIAYDGFESTREQRTLCANATQALGLDFGAVDLAQRADGSLFVLEVNRAPGIEGGTLTAYVGAIQRWLQGGE